MTPDQEQELSMIQSEVSSRLDSKFRKGAAEHTGSDGDWANRDLEWFLDAAIEEALDQLSYLLKAKSRLKVLA